MFHQPRERLASWLLMPWAVHEHYPPYSGRVQSPASPGPCHCLDTSMRLEAFTHACLQATPASGTHPPQGPYTHPVQGPYTSWPSRSHTLPTPGSPYTPPPGYPYTQFQGPAHPPQAFTHHPRALRTPALGPYAPCLALLAPPTATLPSRPATSAHRQLLQETCGACPVSPPDFSTYSFISSQRVTRSWV